MTNSTNGVMMILDDNRGINIPMDFVNEFCTQDNIENGVIKAIDQEQIQILKDGPENENYWDVWDEILQSCKIEFGNDVYTLHQDGCLFMISLENMTPEEYKNLGFEDDCDFKHYEEDELVEEFKEEMKQFGTVNFSDNIMMSEEFNNWMDSLHKDGQITNYQRNNFCYSDE